MLPVFCFSVLNGMSTSRRSFILTAILAPLGVAAAKFLPTPSVVQNTHPDIMAHVAAVIKSDLQRFIGEKVNSRLVSNVTKSTTGILRRLEQEGYIAQSGDVNVVGAPDGTIDITATFRPTQSLYYVNSTFTLCSA
jgi:hypothetical protein